MKDTPRSWWRRLLCRLSWHQEMGVTIAGFIRCYCCSKNYQQGMRIWSYATPATPPLDSRAADALYRALEDLTLALWNRDRQRHVEPEWRAAMEELGYRYDAEKEAWCKP